MNSVEKDSLQQREIQNTQREIIHETGLEIPAVPPEARVHTARDFVKSGTSVLLKRIQHQRSFLGKLHATKLRYTKNRFNCMKRANTQEQQKSLNKAHGLKSASNMHKILKDQIERDNKIAYDMQKRIEVLENMVKQFRANTLEMLCELEGLTFRPHSILKL